MPVRWDPIHGYQQDRPSCLAGFGSSDNHKSNIIMMTEKSCGPLLTSEAISTLALSRCRERERGRSGGCRASAAAVSSVTDVPGCYTRPASPRRLVHPSLDPGYDFPPLIGAVALGGGGCRGQHRRQGGSGREPDSECRATIHVIHATPPSVSRASALRGRVGHANALLLRTTGVSAGASLLSTPVEHGPNAPLQARREAGAQRTVYAFACMPV
jgi:hypothetical protein